MDQAVYKKVYSPLQLGSDRIRILHLRDASQTGEPELKCDLRVASLKDKAQYAALSYTWGPLQFTCDIEVNGSTLKITKTCYDALLYYRDHWFDAEVAPHPEELASSLEDFRTRRYKDLWVDQLCIDQTKADDKVQQIALMKEIYGGAQVVWCWLGKPLELEELAQSLDLSTQELDTRFPGQWSDVDRETVSLLRFLCDCNISRDTGLDPDQKRPDCIKSYVAIFGVNDFFDRPYFGRRWIIQESCSNRATYISYGRYLIDMSLECEASNFYRRYISHLLTISDHFFEMLDKLPQWKRPRHSVCGSIHNIFKSRQQRTAQPGDYLWLLTYCSACLTTYPLDRFYALRSLESAPETLPAIDYDMEPSEACVQHAKAFLRRGYLASVVQLAGSSHQNSSHLPSWCPDWLETPGHPSLYAGNVLQIIGDRTPRITSSELYHLDEINDKLSVLVMMTDQVAHCFSPGPDTALSQYLNFIETQKPNIGNAGALQAMIQVVIKLRQSEPDEVHETTNMLLANAAPELGLRGMRMGLLSLLAATKVYHEFFLIHASSFSSLPFEQRYQEGQKDPNERAGLRIENRLNAMWAALEFFVWGDRFHQLGVTARGYLGLFPRGARAGDFVVAIPQGITLMVVRPRTGDAGEGNADNNPGRSEQQALNFELIGDCYALGLQEAARAGSGTSAKEVPRWITIT